MAAADAGALPFDDGAGADRSAGYADDVADRVLVVDDDATVRDVVARYLGDAGYRVDVAADGESALAAAARERPDAVVLDLMLPGTGGLDVCRALRAGQAPPAIVMLTALGEEDDRIRGLELGADDYVSKPFSPRELVLRIGSVLRRTGPQAAGIGPLVDGSSDRRRSDSRRRAGGRGRRTPRRLPAAVVRGCTGSTWSAPRSWTSSARWIGGGCARCG